MRSHGFVPNALLLATAALLAGAAPASRGADAPAGAPAPAGVAAGADAPSPTADAQGDTGLRLLSKIPVTGMTGTWDHLTADASTGRIFANAQDIHTLEVIDLRAGTVLKAVTGPFNRNQGAAFLANTGQVAITNGRSGTVTFLDAATLATAKAVGIGLGADLMAYDPGAHELFLDHGGRDSNRGFGAVAVIDTVKDELVADIPTDLRPAAMVSEAGGPRLFVCIPGGDRIAVVDRPSRRIVGAFPLTTSRKPVSIALDEADRRLFVLTRNPAQLVVLDMDTGRTVAALPTVGEAEDVFYDAPHRRLYATGLEGVVHTYRQYSADSYALTGRVPVKPHAGSALLVPSMNRFVVAVAEHGTEAPELWVYETLPPSDAASSGPATPAATAPGAGPTPAATQAPGDSSLPSSANDLPAYVPGIAVTGTITSWGHVFMKPAMARWEAGFRRFHPDVRFSDELVSSAAATGALFTHTADLGLVGREIRPMEVAGYARVMKAKPYGIQVMTGAVGNPDKSLALGVFVHRDNPVTRLSFSQLDAAFGAEHRGGAAANARTWGDLGATGDWAARPIHVYQGLLDASPAFYFSTAVMKGSLLWNESTRTFDDVDLPGGHTLTAAEQIVAALAHDPAGIALAGVGTTVPGVTGPGGVARLVAVAAKDGGPWVEPTEENVRNRTYPFTRSVWIYINRAPGAPVDPRVREFLRYILSREGQADVAAEGEYLPLTPALARGQLSRLD